MDVSSSTVITTTATLRPLQCELSTLGNSTGSALWKSGATTVLAAVQGPSAPRQSQLEDSQAGIVSVIIKALSMDASSSTSSSAEQLVEWQVFLSNILSSTCRVESFPRSVVSIILQVQSADGSVLAACLHAAVAALMDAGIEMTCLPVAVTCLLQTSKNNNSSNSNSSATTKIDISLDPTLAQEQRDETGLLCIVVSSSSSSSDSSKNNDKNNIILGCYSAGLKIHAPTLLQCCSLAERAAPAIVAFWRLAVEQKTRREYQTLLHQSN